MEKAKVQNLVRHKSGRYYARMFADNKEIREKPRTSLLVRTSASRRVWREQRNRPK